LAKSILKTIFDWLWCCQQVSFENYNLFSWFIAIVPNIIIRN